MPRIRLRDDDDEEEEGGEVNDGVNPQEAARALSPCSPYPQLQPAGSLPHPSPPPPPSSLLHHPLLALAAGILAATGLLSSSTYYYRDLATTWSAMRVPEYTAIAPYMHRVASSVYGNNLAAPRPANYYARNGMLQIQANEEQGDIRTGVRWLLNGDIEQLTAQNKTGLEDDVVLGDGLDLYREYRAALEADVREGGQRRQNETSFATPTFTDPRFDYLRDKTIFLLGDSIDRYAIDFVCSALGGELSIRLFNSNPSTRRPPDLTKTSRDSFKDPHFCQLPSALGNASIWSWMTYGSVAREDTFQRNLWSVWPRQLDTRLELIRKTMDKFGIRPDIMMLHTVMWDLNAFNIMDAAASRPRKDRLDVKEVVQFKKSTRDLLQWANTHFPQTKKMYRTVHATKVTQGTWFMDAAPPDAKNISRVPYSLNKQEQLNAVVRELAPQYGVELFDFRKALSGYTQTFDDIMHPGPVGKALYTQMLLYFAKWLDSRT